MASSEREEVDTLNEKLNDELVMKDLGVVKRILEMDIVRNQDKGEFLLSQFGYLKRVVE